MELAPPPKLRAKGIDGGCKDNVLGGQMQTQLSPSASMRGEAMAGMDFNAALRSPPQILLNHWLVNFKLQRAPKGSPQWGPTQKRTRCLQFLFPSPHEAAVWPSAIVAKNMCVCSVRMSSSLLKWLILMVASVVKTLAWSGWLSCVDGSSVDGPSGCCLHRIFLAEHGVKAPPNPRFSKSARNNPEKNPFGKFFGEVGGAGGPNLSVRNGLETIFSPKTCYIHSCVNWTHFPTAISKAPIALQ